ncbi:uncharacterized protein N0V89_002326 [Didymosphaeria variabile]|uniref:Uncharacterized protein n=1 Tax=Didymosphaeria variabile TaxID=1932322 RepID=A0A9W8XU59_9PLEO|nr:uncharacterized protein N0V89_002326 [Didymosphaeria variabile]KAJ4357750.1 hypothetical protein N0V89_002326 [Didymosphaeria variabile]
MDVHVPRKRGRPKKYFTVEERREATRASAKKSFQKKKEQERLAANGSKDSSHSTPTASNKSHSMIRPPREEPRAGVPSTLHSSLEKGDSSYPSDNLRTVDGILSSCEVEILAAELKRNPKRHQDLRQDTFNNRKGEKEAHAERRTHGDSDEHSHQPETRSLDTVRELEILAKKIKRKPERYRRILEENLQRDPGQYRDVLDDIRARQALREAEAPERARALMEQWEEGQRARTEGKAWQEVSYGQWATRGAETAQEHVLRQAEARRAEERARQLVKAHEDSRKAKQERLRKAAPEEVRQNKRALEQVQDLSERPEDDFDRHVRCISDWLQATSYGQHHTFPTNGQAIFINKIKPRIHQIERSAMSNIASFAIQYVALMALTHIIRLIYVHRVGKIGAEVLRYYEAGAKLNGVDQLTSAMLEIIEKKVHHEDKAWLKTHQGAAGVLMREMLEVWPMVCSYGPVQVQQNLGGVLWRGFGYRPVPSFR